MVDLKYKKNKKFELALLSNYFLILSCVFLPLQFLSLKVSSSSYDLSVFFVIGFIVCKIFYANISLLKVLKFILVLIIYIINSFYLDFSDPGRFVSAFTWISFLLIIIFFSSDLNFDAKITYYFIFIPLFFIAIYSIFEYMIFGVQRPKSTFDEPSYAGLCFYSVSVGFIARYYFCNIKKFNYLLFASIFFYAGVLTKSMHIITFLISLIFLLCSTKKFSIIRIIFFIILIFVLIFIIILSDIHYLNRLNIFNPKNVSLLVWLRGLDQAIFVINNFPLFGTGLGSTGEFEFNSSSNKLLSYYKLHTLNLTDAYSMLFRLFIEVGLIGVIFFLYNFILKYKNFLSISKNNMKNQIFCFFFALTLIIGILIKEPSYSRSYVFLSALIYFTILNKNNIK